MAKKKVELDAFADLNMLQDPQSAEDAKPVFEKRETEEESKQAPKVKAKTATKKTILKRREVKQRIGFAIYPSLYEKLNKIAYVKNISTSQLMNDILRAYTDSEEGKSLLDEYDEMV